MNTEQQLEVALRILHDICRHADPQQRDVEVLAQLAQTEQERLMSLKDLACAVIIRERKQLREKTIAARY